MQKTPIRNFVQQAIRRCDGRIDILVNSAGINGECQLVQDMSLQRWERTLRVNLTGTMLVAREVIPIMIKRGAGRIVNVASNVARRGLPFRSDYVCSKWAVLGLTQTLALELAQHGIRVNAVCPGPVEGERIEDILRAHAAAERRTMAEVRQNWAAGSPMNRFIDPTEVADVVLFLCSESSRAMTGQALNVTGAQCNRGYADDLSAGYSTETAGKNSFEGIATPPSPQPDTPAQTTADSKLVCRFLPL